MQNYSLGFKVFKLLAIVFSFAFCVLSSSPEAIAAALQNVSDTLSTSKPKEKALHTITFKNQTLIPTGGKISITFQGSGTNPNNSQASLTTFSFNGLTASGIRANFSQGSSSCNFSISLPLNRITCVIQGSAVAVGTQMTFFIGCTGNSGQNCTIHSPILINPSKSNPSGTADIWNVNVRTSDASDNELDFAKTKVAIVESVEVSSEDISGPTPPPPGTTQIEAKVGDYLLSLSGLVSPYASVVLSSSGDFMASTVADSEGFFSINNILIKKGFSEFCFLAVDFKKISDSYTCLKISPATSNVTRSNIFLPPTLGLSKSQVDHRGDVYAFGYTMPNAEVKIDFGRGIQKVVFSDTTGYYIFRIGNLPEGRYELYSTSKYKDLTSLSPTKKIELKSLSLWEQITALRQYLILLLLLIAFGFMLIFRRFLKLDKITVIADHLPKAIPFRKRPKSLPLHHSWMFGF